MRAIRLATNTAIALAVLTTTRCSLQSPYSPPPPPAPPSSAPDAGDPPPERGGQIPAGAQAAQDALAPGGAQPTPRAALARYAQIAVNWSWRDLTNVQRHLASISLGQARAQAVQAAASASADSTLRGQQISNSGQPMSIAPGEGEARGRWVIVTHEHTTGQGSYAGLPPTLHVSYARLTHTSQGFVVSQWQPQQ